MESSITLHIHHGGEFAEKNGVKYYKGGEGSDDSEKEDGNEDESVEDSDSESEKEDGSEDEDYNYVEDMPFTSQLNYKNKQAMEEDMKGFESEYDSDSFKIVGEEISDSNDDDIADSVGTKKKVRKVSKKVYPSFNTRTPMKNIEFETGLIFTDVKTSRNAIIDYMVEQKREIWFKKNDLQRDDLELDTGAGYTLMTDQQKGLKHAINTILPRAEHSWIVKARYKPILDLLDDIRLQGTIYWPKTGFPDIVPPKVRRMPGRPKRHRRREQGEDGGGHKLGKKGVMMHCSQCLKAGHNKSTCKATAEEITDIQKTVAEAKKSQSDSKGISSTKSQGEASTEGAPQLKRKRGRPPKAKNVEVLPPPPPLPPVGILVFTEVIKMDIYTCQ
ncbi:hypothetical protein POM88_003309 [Heracleum sosnowskyi]|uniref:Uncharacterized protein n=1 Tax=Heracleum sosnowskyi TaxID=360622 RepID=A0AAD8JG96_9APIA|nr:hypothetical protein POM88_003309 [Heracleum sosnowskyi]